MYPKFKRALLRDQVGADLAAGGVNLKFALIDTADEAYNAADEFLADVTLAGIIATSGNLTGKAVSDAGVFDCDDFQIAGVSGDTVEAGILYIDTGVAGTSRLVAFLDNGSSFGLTPNGGAVDVTIHASGMFGL